MIDPIKKLIFEGKVPYFLVIKKYLSYVSIASLYVIIDPRAAEDFWEFGWNILIIILFSRPIASLLPKLGILKKVVALRKELWIICGCFILAHGAWYALDDIGIISVIKNDIFNYKSFLFWGTWWTIMMFPLLITSNTFSVKLLWKYWKVLHKLTYGFFIFGAIHIDLIEGEISHSLIILLLIILSTLSYKKVVLWK